MMLERCVVRIERLVSFFVSCFGFLVSCFAFFVRFQVFKCIRFNRGTNVESL
ncbi:hypothetical protein BCR44DRAFT_1430571, partial [Catenaria anguillulae PL171]